MKFLQTNYPIIIAILLFIGIMIAVSMYWEDHASASISVGIGVEQVVSSDCDAPIIQGDVMTCVDFN